MGIPLDKAEFLALFLESFAYGIFFALCWITIFIVFWKRKDKPSVGRLLLSVALIMLVLATAHLVIDFVRAMDAFVILGPEMDGGASSYFGNLSSPTIIAKTVVYWAQTLLNDGIVIWRCYVIYGKRFRVIIPPVLFLFPAFVAGIMTMYLFRHSAPGDTVFATSHPNTIVWFSVTIAINVYCTIMISWRIYSTGRLRSSIGMSMSSLFPVMFVFIESGALITSGAVAFLCAFLTDSNGQYPAMDLLSPLGGIVFCLIILQVRFQTNLFSGPSEVTSPPCRSPIRWASRSSAPPQSRQVGHLATNSVPSTISVENTTHTDSTEEGSETTMKDDRVEVEGEIV